MLKITADRFDALIEAIDQYTRENFDGCVRVGRAPRTRGQGPTFAVSWASVGSVAPEKAAEFICWLQYATELTGALNALHMEIAEGPDPEITTPDEYRDVRTRYLDSLRAGVYCLTFRLRNE